MELSSDVNEGIGGFGDTAFFHKETKTLLVTDAVIRVDNEAPGIIQEDPRALLYHSRDCMTDVVDDTAANRQKGWRRMVLFGLTFQPAGTFKIHRMGDTRSWNSLRSFCRWYTADGSFLSIRCFAIRYQRY